PPTVCTAVGDFGRRRRTIPSSRPAHASADRACPDADAVQPRSGVRRLVFRLPHAGPAPHRPARVTYFGTGSRVPRIGETAVCGTRYPVPNLTSSHPQPF